MSQERVREKKVARAVAATWLCAAAALIAIGLIERNWAFGVFGVLAGLRATVWGGALRRGTALKDLPLLLPFWKRPDSR